MSSGVYERTKEHNKKNSEANKGKKLTKKHRENIKQNHAKYWKGKSRSEETKKKISQSNKNARDNHHLYLKENHNKTILLTKNKHKQLHVKAYDYIYFRYGKEGIDKYIKWFDKKYGLGGKI